MCSREPEKERCYGQNRARGTKSAPVRALGDGFRHLHPDVMRAVLQPGAAAGSAVEGACGRLKLPVICRVKF